MQIPVPDELTLKQIAEWWAVESEPTEEKILDRFSSAFWRGAFEDDLENSCLCLIQPITTDRHGVAMTGSWRFVADEDRWERQESKIDPAPPTKIWNRRRALYVIRPIRKLTLPPTPELWPADGKPKSLNKIVESALWETLAGLGLNWFNPNFRNCMKAATVSRGEFCQVADRQRWGRPRFWGDVIREDQKGRIDPLALAEVKQKNRYEHVLAKVKTLYPNPKKRASAETMAKKVIASGPGKKFENLGVESISKLIEGTYKPANKLGLGGLTSLDD